MPEGGGGTNTILPQRVLLEGTVIISSSDCLSRRRAIRASGLARAHASSHLEAIWRCAAGGFNGMLSCSVSAAVWLHRGGGRMRLFTTMSATMCMQMNMVQTRLPLKTLSPLETF